MCGWTAALAGLSAGPAFGDPALGSEAARLSAAPDRPQRRPKWREFLARSENNNNRCLFFEWTATNYPGVTYSEANKMRHAQRPMSLAVGNHGKLHTSAICAKGIHPSGC